MSATTARHDLTCHSATSDTDKLRRILDFAQAGSCCLSMPSQVDQLGKDSQKLSVILGIIMTTLLCRKGTGFT